jgi:lipoprotein-anchoring transpeptidase ErfK/SrfK
LAIGAAAPARAAAPPVAVPLSNEWTVTRWAYPNALAAARSRPSVLAHTVARLHYFTEDGRPEIYLALERVRVHGHTWVRVRLPMRPNGTLGWIPAAAVSLTPVHSAIVVHRATRRIELFRDGRRVLLARVAVGAPGRETPLGSFYVTARFVPDDPFLGVFALETSAYSKLTEWPGGGVVGIHGTNLPQLIGQRVSHGCVRVLNATADALRRLAPLGTAVTIVDD